MAESDPGQDGSRTAEGELSAREEHEQISSRMKEIRDEMAQEVDENWASTWRTEEVFEVKIEARLGSHDEYQRLLERRRKLEEQEDELASDADDPAADGG